MLATHSLWLRCPQPCVALQNKGLLLLWLCLHAALSAVPGASCVPRLEGVMSWLCWPQDLHIYTEVSLYRETGGGELQACRQRLRGLPSTQDSSS